MYRIYKSEKVNLGEPKSINHIDLKLIRNADKENCLQSEKSKNQIAKDIIEEARMLYADIIEDANNEALIIIEKTNAELKLKEKETYEKAYKEGLEKGFKEGKTEAQEIIDQAKSIKDYLTLRKNDILKESEADLIELIIDISKKVINQELIQNEDIIISLIRQAMERSTFNDNLTIKVSAEDYAYVSERKDIIASLVEGVLEIEVIEDRFLKKGDCILDTIGGQVNTSIQHQIEELEKAFMYILRNE